MAENIDSVSRSSLQVIVDLLKACVDKTSENELVASTSSSSKFIRKCIEFLSEKQFIEIAEKSRVHIITGRGLDFLDNFEKLSKLLETQNGNAC